MEPLCIHFRVLGVFIDGKFSRMAASEDTGLPAFEHRRNQGVGLGLCGKEEGGREWWILSICFPILFCW